MNEIANNIANLNLAINTTKLNSKYNQEVTLLAVSKHHSITNIIQAFNAGISNFGENKLQEALPKINALKHLNLCWHFIGAIQSNKAKAISENFNWVQSVSSFKIAESLNKYRQGNKQRLNILLQINISEELQKSGLTLNLQEIIDIASSCNNLENINLRGIMCLPQATNDFEEQCHIFKKMRHIFNMLLEQGLDLDTISMGMSNDFKAAILQGSTMVRIGSSIFGSRLST